VQLAMVLLDDINVRVHQKAAGAVRKGDLQLSEAAVERLAALMGPMGQGLSDRGQLWPGYFVSDRAGAGA